MSDSKQPVRFIIYDTTTEEITRQGVTHRDNVEAQAEEGESTAILADATIGVDLTRYDCLIGSCDHATVGSPYELSIGSPISLYGSPLPCPLIMATMPPVMVSFVLGDHTADDTIRYLDDVSIET